MPLLTHSSKKLRQQFINMTAIIEPPHPDTAPQSETVATSTIEVSLTQESLSQDSTLEVDMSVKPLSPIPERQESVNVKKSSSQDGNPKAKVFSVEPINPASEVHKFDKVEKSSSNEVIPKVEDMLIKPLSPVPQLRESDKVEKLLSPTATPEAKKMSAEFTGPVPEIRVSDKVQKAALASPFHSPKQAAKELRSETAEFAEEAAIANTSDPPVGIECTQETKIIEAVVPVVNGDKESKDDLDTHDNALKSFTPVHGLQTSKVRAIIYLPTWITLT
jgi:hypothetical protein